jgi:hypothetical protein
VQLSLYTIQSNLLDQIQHHLALAAGAGADTAVGTLE